MTTSLLRSALVAFSVAATIPAFAAEPVKVAQTDKGKAFVDKSGMTLYTFAKDPAGKSVCNDACARNWPPFMAADADAGAPAKGWSVVARDDGGKQWAHNGKPLYTFIKDKKPGEASGDGFMDGAWKIAAP
jgi:predicted lipoprotein with Yx(FWY)xxD motif